MKQSTSDTQTQAALIAVDWGTSNFRAFLLDHAGNILDTCFAKQGLLHVANNDFAAVLKQQIGDYLADNPKLPVVMAGMVGARQGWQEAPHLPCPILLSALANHLQPIQDQPNIWIVPGLRIDYPDGRVDVMRGEETQILGCLDVQAKTPQVFCLPGTHSKWAWVEGGQLQRFSTFMTGELFNLLFKYSILGKSVKQPRAYVKAFHRGLDWSQHQEHLLSQLFQVRTQMLAGQLPMEEVYSFLSGLMVGHEVAAMVAQPLPQPVHVVGNRHTSSLYAMALKRYKVQSVLTLAEQATTAGIFKLARQAGLV